MAANRLPYFPFHADDWLNDPAVMAMDADAEGCYIRLLARSWKSATPGVVPSNLVSEMSGLYRVSEDRRERVLSQLAAAFDVKDDKWTQKRMTTEGRRAQRLIAARKAGAAKTNGARGSLAERPLSVPVSDRLAVGNREVEVEVEVKKNLPPTPSQSLPDWVPRSEWDAFVEHRKTFRGGKFTERARLLNLRRLSHLRDEGHDPKALLELAVERGWRGLFAPMQAVAHPNGNGKPATSGGPRTAPRPDDPVEVVGCERCGGGFRRRVGDHYTRCMSCEREGYKR